MFNPRTAQVLRDTSTAVGRYSCICLLIVQCFSLLCAPETKPTDERKALASACCPSHTSVAGPSAEEQGTLRAVSMGSGLKTGKILVMHSSSLLILYSSNALQAFQERITIEAAHM